MAEFITTIKPFAFALAGGIIPALLWLWFWHRQDSECPEPKGLVMLSFLAGMVVVFFVLPVQKLIVALIPVITSLSDLFTAQFSLLAPNTETLQNILLAATEEAGKYATVFLIAINSKHFDEPIDAVIYLITVALGFAAMENTLYILKDLTQNGVIQTIINGNMRFLGATLLHTISSAFIGIAIAFAFYAPRWVRAISAIIGIIVATLLHTHFNLTIMETSGTLNILTVFSRYWIVVVGIIIMVGMIKYIFNRKKICIIV